MKNEKTSKSKKKQVKYTKTKTLSEDASGRHVLLCFYLCEVEGAGEDEDIHQVDEALQEGDGRFHCQTLRGFYVLQFMLVEENAHTNKGADVYCSRKTADVPKQTTLKR